MKILTRHEHGASHYIYTGLGNAFVNAGHEFGFWNAETKPAFDVFDEFQPDLFIGQGYSLDRATVKCIVERPNLKVLLKVGCYGDVCKEIDTDEYPILTWTQDEWNYVGQVSASNKTWVFNYCHPNRVDYLIGTWEKLVGSNGLVGLLPAADTSIYKPVPSVDSLKCDVAFVGGYWPYKAQNLDKYIIPLCYPVGKYNIKIFGNQGWPVPQYMGSLDDQTAVNLFSSATVCPNISEPHANVFGFEVNERVFKLAACKAFFISDFICSLEEDIFVKHEAVLAESSEHFVDLVHTFVTNPDLRNRHIENCYETVMEHHTYTNRVEQILCLEQGS
jgi:hypothetical protein